MTSYIPCFNNIRGINEADETRVQELIASILANGWIGAPILHCGTDAVTGSQRLEALARIQDMHDDATHNGERFPINPSEMHWAFEDVTEIVEAWMAKEDEDFSRLAQGYPLRYVFEDTHIATYANEITEW